MLNAPSDPNSIGSCETRSRSSASIDSNRIRRLQKQLKLLRDHRQDSLSHRAGDIEIAIESVIFEQLVTNAEQTVGAGSAFGEKEAIQKSLDRILAAVLGESPQPCPEQEERLAALQKQVIEQELQLADQEHLLDTQRGQLATSETAMLAEQQLVAELKATIEALQNDCTQFQHEIATNYIEKMEHDLVVSQLESLRAEYNQLVEFVAAHPAAASTDTNDVVFEASDEEYETLRRQVAELQAELESVRSQPPQDQFDIGLGTDDVLVESLREQLIEERQKIVELRLELEEVNAAFKEKQEIPSSQRSASLTWEEQKARLLAHLESESQACQIEPGKELEIREIVSKTQCEIECRDKEIMELKRLLAEQATASESMAIGAAAVAELLNHDDLITEEREKLRQLQDQWKLKLREAEVEVSMERAKLARQRSELEERLKDLEREHTKCLVPDEKKSSGNRWLSRLGLGEGEK